MPTVYKKDALTGGAAGALDGVSGEGLVSSDIAWTLSSDNTLFLHENTTTATAENSPWHIVPDSCAGSHSWRWHTDPMISFREVLATTGASITNWGVSYIRCGTATDAYTMSLASPVQNAFKHIVITGGSSHTVRIKNTSSDVRFGADGTSGPHLITSDSDVRAGSILGNTIVLHATGSASWQILGIGSTVDISLTTAISS